MAFDSPFMNIFLSMYPSLWRCENGFGRFYFTAQGSTHEITYLAINVENIRSLKDCWTTCSGMRTAHLFSLRRDFYYFRNCHILVANTSTGGVYEKLNNDLTGSKCGLLLAEDAQDGNFTKISCHDKSWNNFCFLKFPDKISSWSFFVFLHAGADLVFSPCK